MVYDMMQAGVLTQVLIYPVIQQLGDACIYFVITYNISSISS